jgi:hypothetical protein
MRAMTDQMIERESLLRAGEVEIDELPLRVVPDWDRQVERADAVCRLIDRHLDYEARGRILRNLNDFRPQHLCPEQRVQMVSDVYPATC